MLFPLGLLSQGGGAGGGAAFELIETQLLNSTTASVTFSSIPSTYKHLQIRYTASNSSGSTDYFRMRANGDATGGNYTRHVLYGNGSSVTSAGYAGAGQTGYFGAFGDLPSSNFPNQFLAGIIDVLDYASTNKYKTAKMFFGWQVAHVSLASGVWMSTAAINSLTFYSVNTSLATGSRFSLYGIKGA